MPEVAYPFLAHLFSAYMHQDWGTEGKDWPDLVRNYIRDEPSADSAAVAAEVQRLMADFSSDTALAKYVWQVLGCYYDPRPDSGGSSVREWLGRVAEYLRRPAKHAEPGAAADGGA